jgi:hypothetical protein
VHIAIWEQEQMGGKFLPAEIAVEYLITNWSTGYPLIIIKEPYLTSNGTSGISGDGIE